MNSEELQKIIEKIVGLRLNTVNCVCEMLVFDFTNDEVTYAIHSQCLTRIIKNDDILVTTLDYQSWDMKEDENNDEWYNLKIYKSVIENGIVTSVKLNSLYDLIITLDNGIIIQFYIKNSYAHYDEEKEQYRFFEVDKDENIKENKKLPPHYVIYSKYIEIVN